MNILYDGRSIDLNTLNTLSSPHLFFLSPFVHPRAMTTFGSSRARISQSQPVFAWSLKPRISLSSPTRRPYMAPYGPRTMGGCSLVAFPPSSPFPPRPSSLPAAAASPQDDDAPDATRPTDATMDAAPVRWPLFLVPALGGLLFGYDIGSSSAALASLTDVRPFLIPPPPPPPRSTATPHALTHVLACVRT